MSEASFNRASSNAEFRNTELSLSVSYSATSIQINVQPASAIETRTKEW
jgi:hypothetical protein